MIALIKNMAYSEPLAYRIYYELIRKRSGRYPRLPQKSDDFYFDGYPRSGNTYTANLIKHVFPGLEWTHHLHAEAVLKMALKKKLKCLVIIRNPVDAIASFTYTKSTSKIIDISLIEACMERYINYYSFVAFVKEEIDVVDFNFVIKNQVAFLHWFSDKCAPHKSKNNIEPEIIVEYDKKMLEKEKSKVLEYSSLPSVERAEFKSLIKSSILAHRNYKEAVNLYHILKNS